MLECLCSSQIVKPKFVMFFVSVSTMSGTLQARNCRVTNFGVFVINIGILNRVTHRIINTCTGVVIKSELRLMITYR